MTSVNHYLILLNLRELGSVAEQRGLWLGEGTQTHGEVSSFVEACCGLFDDSVLDEVLYSSGTGFGSDVDTILKGIDELLSGVDSDRPEEEIIADPAMAKIRELASDAFRRIMSAGMRNKGRIIDRLLEWRDEGRRRELWLPPRAGVPARSSPRDAYWHLFYGKDCWLYLNLGWKEREFSPLFFELANLVSHLVDDRRPLDDILSDPLLVSGSRKAAEIIGRIGRPWGDAPDEISDSHNRVDMTHAGICLEFCKPWGHPPTQGD